MKQFFLNRIYTKLEYNQTDKALNAVKLYTILFGYDPSITLAVAHCFIHPKLDKGFIEQLRIVYKYWSNTHEYNTLKMLYYVSKHKTSRALVCANKTIEINSKLAELYNNRGYLKNIIGLYEEAIEDFNKSIHLDSELFEAFNNRGYSRLKLGDKESYSDIKFSIDNSPNNAVAFKNLALWEVAFGDSNKVPILLKKAKGKKFYNLAELELKRLNTAQQSV